MNLQTENFEVQTNYFSHNNLLYAQLWIDRVNVSIVQQHKFCHKYSTAPGSTGPVPYAKPKLLTLNSNQTKNIIS